MCENVRTRQYSGTHTTSSSTTTSRWRRLLAQNRTALLHSARLSDGATKGDYLLLDMSNDHKFKLLDKMYPSPILRLKFSYWVILENTPDEQYLVFISLQINEGAR